LHEARPNPFNPGTVVAFDLARAERVRIVIADVRGRRVRLLVDEVRPAGTHHAPWDGRNDGGQGVASGVYFVQMQSGRYSSVRKLVLLK
jgi:flagellar hook assembly protein FlgD